MIVTYRITTDRNREKVGYRPSRKGSPPADSKELWKCQNSQVQKRHLGHLARRDQCALGVVTQD